MKSELQRIFVFGASGHAKVVIDIVERQRLFEIAFLVDDDPALKGKEIYGYPVIGGKKELIAERREVSGGIVAIGSNGARASVAGWLAEMGFSLVSAIHPAAQLARRTVVGDGTVIMAGVVVNPDASIGNNVILNTRASIDHGCEICDGVHIAPGVTLCGSVHVGEGAFVCAGATIIPNISIGAHAVIGAGATVIRDVPDRTTVVGSPARPVRKEQKDDPLEKQ